MNRLRLDARFWLTLLAVYFVTAAVHEGGHWLAGALQGAEMSYSLNGVERVGGAELSRHGSLWVTAAGPLVTIVQALTAFLVVLRTRSVLAYGFLFSAAFMRWMAAAISLFNPNDEARLSMEHGWGPWTLPAVVVAGLVALTVIGSRRLGLGWKVNGLMYLVATVAVTLVVGLDALLTR